MKEDDPRRKYKARGVFQGSDVRGEDGYRAVFNDLGSAPVSMPAGKSLTFTAYSRDTLLRLLTLSERTRRPH